MKETIYTIPINEAFESAMAAGDAPDAAFCPVCRLHGRLEADSLEYILGASMMEPDVRLETNRLGFCGSHWDKMLAERKRLPLSLILQTHLETLMKNAAKRLADGESCYACERVGLFLGQYYNNILYLWSSTPEFRTRFETVPVLCLRHLSGLAAAAKKSLSKKENAVFGRHLEQRIEKEAGVLYESVSAFCKSFDHRFAEMDITAHKHSAERSVVFLTGERL